MLIKMIKTEKGSPNGINVFTYDAGKEYEVDEKLARVFVKMGSAENKVETKDTGAAPFNKEVKVEDNKEDNSDFRKKSAKRRE